MKKNITAPDGKQLTAWGGAPFWDLYPTALISVQRANLFIVIVIYFSLPDP